MQRYGWGGQPVQQLSLQPPPTKKILIRLVIVSLLLAGLAFKTRPIVVSSQATTGQPAINGLAQSLGQLNSYTVATAKPPLIYAQSYLLLDPVTNEVLLGQNIDSPSAIASTTKMTTALVALATYPSDQVVTVDQRATSVTGSKVGLVAGERMTVANLVAAMLIQSGNDAAYALAFADQPNNPSPTAYQSFVDKMNQFAIDHHLTHSHYGDPAGLDDEEGRSTAFELSQVARLVLANPTLAKIVATPTTTISSVDGTSQHQLKNSNHLLLTDDPLYLAGVVGVKTGFTLTAGHCLVSAYQLPDRLIIGVVMNTTESTITASAKEMRKLFVWSTTAVTLANY